MITEVYPGIYKNEIPLPKNPLRAINSYVLTADENNLIIDTGFNTQECQDALLAGLNELKLDLAKTDLFVTHMHVDHSGLAPLLKQHGVRNIYFSQVDGNLFNSTSVKQHSSQRREFFETLDKIFGFEKDTKFGKEFGQRLDEPLKFTSLSEGDKLTVGRYHLEVVDIPGHTPGQIGLYEREHKLFFSGDHILDEITPNITFWSFDQDILATYIENLNKLNEFEIDYLFTAHRKLITDHRQRIAELIEHHKERLQEILAILQAGKMTVNQIAGSMHWDLSYKKWEDFPSAQKWFASGEALSHLEHLVHSGKVVRLKENETLYYQLNIS